MNNGPTFDDYAGTNKGDTKGGEEATATVGTAAVSFPSLMDRDNDDDNDNDVDDNAASQPPFSKEDDNNNNYKLHIDTGDDGNNSHNNNDNHNNLISYNEHYYSEEKNTHGDTTTSTATDASTVTHPSTPTVEIIDESGCCDTTGGNSSSAAAAAASSSSGATGTATTTSSGGSPFLLNKWSTAWRSRNNQQPHQPAAATTVTAASAAAAATATAFWNKHKSPSFEHGLKRMSAVVATLADPTSTSTFTTAAATTTTTTAQPLESAKLESPLATMTTVTADTATTAAATTTTPSTAGAGSAENQENAATAVVAILKEREKKKQEHNNEDENANSDHDNDDDDECTGGGASTDGGGGGDDRGGSRYYSRSRSSCSDDGSSYWSSSSNSSNDGISDDDGSSSTAAARGRRGNSSSATNTNNNNSTPPATAGAANAILRGTLKWTAVSSAVDSMQQSYRGRYNNNNINGGQQQQNNNNNNSRTNTSTAAALAAALVSGGVRGRPNNTVFPSNNNNNNNNTSQEGEDGTVSTTTTTTTDATITATNNNNVSHTQRLLHSRAHDHVTQLMKNACTTPHEYLLLLGHGMLGVNLKPTYLLNHGVYVDFLVPGGAAHASNLVYPGDLLCQIGNVLNVRNGSILDIPTQLAATKRPVHLVLSSGTDYYSHHHHHHDSQHHVEYNKPKKHHHHHHMDNDKTCYINHIDLCAAILHVILNPIKDNDDDDETKEKVEVLPEVQDSNDNNQSQEQDVKQDLNGADKQQIENEQQKQSSLDDQHIRSNSFNDQQDTVESRPALKGPDDEETDGSSATPVVTMTNAMPPKHENDSNDDIQTTTTTTSTATDNKKEEEESIIVVIPNTIHQVEDLLHAQIPTKAVRNVWGRETARRANHLQPRHVEEIWTMTTTTTSGSTLAAITGNDWNNLQMSLKHAFILTVLDGRRFPFLTRFWTMQPALLQAAAATTTASAQANNNVTTTTAMSPTAATPHAIMLTLFLEMHTYCDLYGVTPVDKLRLLVRSIAYKFFLPTSLGNNELVPPLFDFHHIVPDSSIRQLELVLKKMKNNTNDNNESASLSLSCPPRDVFWDFQQAVLDILAGEAFLSFIITDECARMRAFLRETAPYLNVPLDRVWQHLVQSNGSGGCGSNNNDDRMVTKNSEEDAKNAKNYFLYMLVYLLCQMDHEPFGEHGELPATSSGNETANSNNISNIKTYNRMEEATSGICAALFIQSRLLPSIQAVRNQTILNENKDNVDHDKNLTTLVSDFEQLWEIFLSPVVGVLHRALQSQETKARLRIVLDRLTDIQTFAQHERNAKKNANDDIDTNFNFSSDLLNKLVDVKLVRDLHTLAQELVYYEYALVNHSKFRAHKFHEWMCTEAAKVFATLDEPDTSGIPSLPVHCIKRLLRKAEFPQGVSSHKPAHHVISTTTSDSKEEEAATAGQQAQDDPDDSLIGAECAVVFGTNIGINLADSGEEESPALEQNDIRRYTCQSLRRRSPKGEANVHETGGNKILEPENVPQMVESYAIVPPSRTPAFVDYVKDSWKSRDGWEVSLVNFMLPRAGATQDGSDAPMYGVSLVLSRQPALSNDLALDEEDYIPSEYVEWFSSADDETETFSSPISFSAPSSSTRITTPMRRVRLSKEIPNFCAQLSKRSWRDQVSLEQQRASTTSTVTVGIALVSQRNNLISMRDTLSRLVQDFTRPADDDVQHGNRLYSCAALVDALGNCANPNIEPESLRCILDPYLRLAAKPWIERPIGEQERVFKRMAGEQLVKSLPPIPLALMFVTVLLEQKVVFSSSRRSLLLSATTALSELLKPLRWCHLMVPRVPCTLAGDLLQYPAPFILGMPSEDPGILDLIQDLPDDITLVDLDVGRVILAPTFAHNADIRQESSLADDVTTARAIRSQVLYLAQSLGTVFGSCMDPITWSCDRLSAPLTTDVIAYKQQQVGSSESTQFDRLKAVCHDFLQELLAGTTSCCYWVEEATSSTSPTSTIEPTVLFDEDRFFRLKNQRFQKQQQGQQHGNHRVTTTSFQPLLRPPQDSTRLALSCDGWWLVMEILLRCQNMNDYIGTRDAKEMMFSL